MQAEGPRSTGREATARGGRPTFTSTVDLWRHRVGSTPDLPAFMAYDGSDWQRTTWREADVEVRAMAAGLLTLGVASGECVALLASTSLPWVLIDMAIQTAGAATTTLFPRSPDAVVQHILADAGAVVAAVGSTAEARQVLQRARPDADGVSPLPDLHTVLVLTGHVPDAAVADGVPDGIEVLGLDALRARGLAHLQQHPDALEARTEALGPDSLATMIYTSGTTGLPKGVRLSHDSWVYAAEAIDQLDVVHPLDVQLLFLPLAHVFAKVLAVAAIHLGVTSAVDGQLDRLDQMLTEVRPTWLGAVPRVFEKIEAAVRARVAERGVLSRKAFEAALSVGRRVAHAQRHGGRVGRRLQAQHALADRWVLRPLRQQLGGRLRFVISGAAPLSQETASFFEAIGVQICEGYGLTESSAASCVNTPDDNLLGTVGRPLPGTQVRIADDGEILLRSRGVMLGYHNLPDATAEAIDAEGWLHTGDVGTVLGSGHVRITDRKKELIVTANGKNVAPALVEHAIRAASGFVEHVVVHGDRRNHLTALVTLNMPAVEAWAAAEGISWRDAADLAEQEAIHELIGQGVRDANRGLPPWERVRRYRVLPAPFTVANGLLTPSMKVRRREVERTYNDLLDGMYS